MNSRLARLLTRLYPPAWRARYGAEYRMFLEARRVSTAEILNLIWHAAVEHVLEDWRYGPNLVALLFSVEGALCLAGGYAGNTIAQHPALATTWRADHLVSPSIIIGTTVMLFWEDVVHPRGAE